MAKRQKLQAAPENKAVTASAVWIGCRLPNGVILDVRELVETEYEGKVRKYYGDVKERRVLRGIGQFTLPNKERRWQPALSLKLTDGEASLTLIDKDFWEEALRQNQALQNLVKKGLVFVEATREAAIDKADEMAGTKTGFEQFEPSKDPQFKGIAKLNDKDMPTGKE
jgi:hypothetical protein